MPSTSHPRINAYCASHGWLFDDLKRQFAEYGAIVSDQPIAAADGYICIRTMEFRNSPRPERTVVQIHDMNRHRIDNAGCVTLVHPAQRANILGFGGKIVVRPIGSRPVVLGELPAKPTIGFFCRETGQTKRSAWFAEAVLLARRSADFQVLTIGHGLEAIRDLGRYERRSAGPDDYARITAFVTLNRTAMVAISAYEACAAGRMVITTPRIWPGDSPWAMVRTAEDVPGLARWILEAVRQPRRFTPEMPYRREDWIRHQIAEARRLCRLSSS